MQLHEKCTVDSLQAYHRLPQAKHNPTQHHHKFPIIHRKSVASHTWLYHQTGWWLPSKSVTFSANMYRWGIESISSFYYGKIHLTTIYCTLTHDHHNSPQIHRGLPQFIMHSLQLIANTRVWPNIGGGHCMGSLFSCWNQFYFQRTLTSSSQAIDAILLINCWSQERLVQYQLV